MAKEALAGAAIVLAVIATAAVVFLSGGELAAPVGDAGATNVVKVERGSLSATVSMNGTLSYGARSEGSPFTVINQMSGTATWLPAVGQVVEQGQVVYRVDESPVVLFYGSIPAYRSLSAGMTGADVRQLNMNLVALGYATPAELPDGTEAFIAATVTALKKLQATLGTSETGTLPFGQAVFQTHAVRVTTLPATLGGHLQAGQPVVQGTSTTRVVIIDLDAAQQSKVSVGNEVVIVLPDNSTAPGVVTSVGTVATTPSSSSEGGGRGSDSPTVSVEVQPTNPTTTGRFDQAPVQVKVTSEVVENALSVPVTAIVGKSGGGFAVEVVREGRHDLVAVKLGLFDSTGGRVQVEGGLHEGDEVVVPSL